MANNLKRNPLVIDTAGASTIKSGLLWPVLISFNGYTTGAADSAVLKRDDGAGGQVVFATLQGKADKTQVDIILGQGVAIKDLAVTTLSSGIVTIYTRDGA